MAENIDVEFLISLVESRPVLWDKTLESYKDRNVTKNAWREILLEVKPDFEELEDKEKNTFGKDVIRRWTNLRDAFARSKRKMKDSKRSGTDAKKPKKYVYNDQLQFLNKLYEVRETVDSLNDETRHGTENNSEHIEVEANASFTIDETINKRTRNRKHRKPEEVELKILKALEPEKQNSKMSFFQSLLPHLDRFDENELLQFQMGVLQVIANINEKKKMVPQVPPPFPQSIPIAKRFGMGALFTHSN
ncbi:uncharacterized protein [Leptinotarsa decemlineata]|uniref:uncharacterized protein n=1 Tax=Leptinotarsa decemlineata TaxID=7539 RepID=UPI003D30A41D